MAAPFFFFKEYLATLAVCVGGIPLWGALVQTSPRLEFGVEACSPEVHTLEGHS